MEKYNKNDEYFDEEKQKDSEKADHEKINDGLNEDIDFDLTKTPKKDSAQSDDDFIVER